MNMIVCKGENNHVLKWNEERKTLACGCGFVMDSSSKVMKLRPKRNKLERQALKIIMARAKCIERISECQQEIKKLKNVKRKTETSLKKKNIKLMELKSMLKKLKYRKIKHNGKNLLCDVCNIPVKNHSWKQIESCKQFKSVPGGLDE